MKYEWKKQDKDLYGAKKTPSLITVPKQNYIMISGQGNPNDRDFSGRVSALFSLAYGIKMGYKAAANAETDAGGIHDFTVYPLEGVWDLKHGGKLIKEELEYTIMIRQPDFITESMVTTALAKVKVKKPNPLYDEIRFGTMQDGDCVEILHVGSYDDEPSSFAQMAQFSKDNGLTRRGSSHREIYLNNPERTDASRLKTILRYPVK